MDEEKKTPSERLVLLEHYLLENANYEHLVSPDELIDYLFSRDIRVEKKMLYKDIKKLKNLGIEIAYFHNNYRRGYYIKNPPFEPIDVQYLIDSVQASSFLTQQTVKGLTEKLKKLTGGYSSLIMKRPTLVAGRVRNMNNSVINETKHLYNAIQNDTKVEFKFFHPLPREGEKRYSYNGKAVKVSPFTLYWSNGFLYLYAYDGKKFRFYRVDRMEGIRECLKEKREGKDLYRQKELTDQKAKIFDMYKDEDQVYKVKMRFHNSIAGPVFDQFQRGGDVMPIPDGEYFTIMPSVYVGPTFYAWLSTFGKKAQILFPPVVVDGMRAFLQESMEMYKEDGAM